MSASKPSLPRKASRPAPAPLLFHADSNDPDMYHFGRFRTSDPIMAFSADGRKYGLAIPMEYNRMKTEGAFDEVLLLPEVRAAAARRFKLPAGTQPDDSQVVRHLARQFGIGEFTIGSRFPAGLALQLRDAGVKLTVAANGCLLPSRELKTPAEVEALRRGNDASAAGLQAVAKALAAAKIRGNRLVHQGRTLTSARLREIIAMAALAEGAVALDTIAAGGDQACDCHNAGDGPIRPGELIVVDIFPRRTADGYWGDMTRTFLKGKASDARRHLVETVKQAHELGIRQMRPGAIAGKVQAAVETLFAKAGYVTVKDSREPEGFFHALGHGIGLEVHEPPIVRAASPVKLRAGMVITVEPGLYYRGIGGARIEDVVHLVPGGNELISKASYRWEIP
jgi:Xaa-Pro aminopeptidase